MRQKIQGMILIDKPIGLTSRQVTTQVSRIFLQRKAGHLGTLDPQATGLLPILLGSATRLAVFLENDEKQYLARIRLGQARSTMDQEGEVIFSGPVPKLSKEEIGKLLEKFVGEIEQTPPMYSALKHQGKRLYELARQGEEVTRKPRRVKIFKIELKSILENELEILVHCSAGTYLRVLADDLGKELKCGAHLSALRRIKSGRFSVEQSIPLDQLMKENRENYLIPLEEILDFEKIEVTDEIGYQLQDGRPIPLQAIGVEKPKGTLLRIFSKPCFAIAEVAESKQELVLKPLKVFGRG